MEPAPIPGDEVWRLAALESPSVLDTDPDPELDRITSAASKFLDTPIPLVSSIDSYRQWFKSRVGLGASETPRDVSFWGFGSNGRETDEYGLCGQQRSGRCP